MNNGVTKLRRGFDIKLAGKADDVYLDIKQPNLFALKPTDVIGIAPIPKLKVAQGDEVRAGQPIFFDKPSPEIMYSSPVSGEVVEVRRGAKRSIAEVVLLADSEISYHEYAPINPDTASREDIVNRLLESGAWVLMRQRPYHTVPRPDVVPRDIFISCFDTAPLAPDHNKLIEGKQNYFQKGINVLAKLTSGNVHLGVSPDSADVFKKASNASVHTFVGKHPAGNVGVHIHHVAPLNKGEIIWTLKPQDVAIIGKLFEENIFDAERTIAVTGDKMVKRGYYKTRIGASIKALVEGNLVDDHVRYISGNALTGTRIEADGFIGLFEDQLTVITEGDQQEFLGWLFPSYPRPSLSRTFPSFLFPDKEYSVNTNNHGEERAYVVTGQYEQVLPMDIHPQHLVRSIMYQDFDQMEGLGIYELVEEDVALCEFVCTSKQPVQKILREGLDLMRIEG